GIDPGAGQVEESDVVGSGGELAAEPRSRLWAAVELGEVEDGEVQFSHDPSVRRVLIVCAVCCEELPAIAWSHASTVDIAAYRVARSVDGAHRRAQLHR